MFWTSFLRQNGQMNFIGLIIRVQIKKEKEAIASSFCGFNGSSFYGIMELQLLA